MPTLAQLKEAVAIAEEIEKLTSQLNSLIGGAELPAAAPKAAAAPVAKTGKRQMSPEARARIAAAQRARWAKSKGLSSPAAKTPAVAPGKKKRGLTPEGRARIVAALKARWAAKRRAS
jgi:hypothetical protein